MVSKRKPPANKGAGKGYDPYNKPAPKTKTPDHMRSSPRNPRNNAGAKVASSGRGPKSIQQSQAARQTGKVDNVSKGMSREFNRATPAKNTFTRGAAVRGVDAGEGIVRKNAAKAAANSKAARARPSKIGWAKAGGGAKGSAVKWGTAGARVAKVASAAGRLASFAGNAGNVVGAGMAGYQAGTALNKKYNISGRIVDAISPKYDPNAGSSRKKRK